MMPSTFDNLLDMARRRPRDGQLIADIAHAHRYAAQATLPADRHWWLNRAALMLRILLAPFAGQQNGPHLWAWDAKHHAHRYAGRRA
jgi:hypothetical protein